MDGHFHFIHTHTYTSLNRTASILLNREAQESFTLRSETKQGCYYLDCYLTLFQHY